MEQSQTTTTSGYLSTTPNSSLIGSTSSSCIDYGTSSYWYGCNCNIYYKALEAKVDKLIALIENGKSFEKKLKKLHKLIESMEDGAETK